MLGHFQFCSLEIFDIQTPITLFFKAAFSWLEAVIQRRSIKNVFLKISLNVKKTSVLESVSWQNCKPESFCMAMN